MTPKLTPQAAFQYQYTAARQILSSKHTCTIHIVLKYIFYLCN